MMREIYKAIIQHWESNPDLTSLVPGQLSQEFPDDNTTNSNAPFAVIKQQQEGATTDRTTCDTIDNFRFEITVHNLTAFPAADKIAELMCDLFEDADLVIDSSQMACAGCYRDAPPLVEEVEKSAWIAFLSITVLISRST